MTIKYSDRDIIKYQISKIKNQEKEIAELKAENEQLKKQIEKLKTCGNCGNRISHQGKCFDCGEKTNWIEEEK